MNLDDPQDRSVAAGEYVLGTLAADVRRAFEQRLARDSALRAEVYAWQDRLLPLAQRIPPTDMVPAESWPAIESRLRSDGAAAKPRQSRDAANDPLWQRLRRWQIAGGAAIAAALVLAALLLLRGPGVAPERYLAVLQDPASNAAGWVVEVTAGDSVRLVPVAAAAAPLPAGKALQFWTKPEGAAGPTSLGLVPPGRVTELPVARLPAIEPRQLFELTLEPDTGSPIGRPTGPILFVGRSIRL